MRLRTPAQEGPQQLDTRRSLWAGALSTLLIMVIVLCGAWSVGCGDPTGGARDRERTGDWDGALAEYERVLSGDPDSITALSGAAVALTVLQRYDEALSLQERVVSADPKDAQTRIELGFNYLNHQGRPLDAVRVLAEAAVLEPTAKNITFLAQAQKRTGDLEGAERSLRQAIAKDAGYGYAYSQLAGLLVEQGRDGEAAQVVEDARSRGVDVSEPL
jgi:tetratricopeptide (TPR) repeat protein